MLLLVLIVLGGLAVYVMTPDERARLVGTGMTVITKMKNAAIEAMERSPEGEPFGDALRERTPRVLVTPTIVVLNAAMFVAMLSGAGALSDPATLIHWGGNFGPRTTNGEWWRLVTAMFVHSGAPHLLANIIGFLVLGSMLERLVGHLAFAAVYLAAGILTGLVSLSAHPVSVNVGASGAIFGIYGLLLASLIWGMIRRSILTIPLVSVRKLVRAAAVFMLYHLTANGTEPTADFTGLVAGFVFGLVITRGISAYTPPTRRLTAALTAAAAMSVIYAVPLRGLSDVRPEIERVMAIEARTASIYEGAVDQFRLGGITGRTLAQLIDRTIIPELQAAGARLNGLGKVPAAHQALVAGAEQYLRLRDRSWRLRAEALQQSNIGTLRKADQIERASLEALERIRPVLRPAS